ncbi:hypothetical protein N7512_001294 [Penicillium capsulatum]|nr:hypothetical protein N7512_001294 [Penicillium capsulatum]
MIEPSTPDSAFRNRSTVGSSPDTEFKKLQCLQDQESFRIPDMFDVYMYNDFHSYGIIELTMNVLLDFYLAKDDLKVQWSLCEAVALFFLHGMADPLTIYEDMLENDMGEVVLAYANKHVIGAGATKVALPASDAKVEDPWGYEKALNTRPSMRRRESEIVLTSRLCPVLNARATARPASPLSKDMIAMLKQGLEMQRG